MNVTAACQVCEETFNCTSRKPLVLPCGHTYCLACLTGIETAGSKLCPSCRESWNCHAYQLPISYMLIPNNNSGQKNTQENENTNYDVCFSHSCPLEYWCCKCQVATCKTCVSENHFAHGNRIFDSLFANAGHAGSVKENFTSQIVPKMLRNIKASTDICNEGLVVTELLKETEKSLLSCKKSLLDQEKYTNDCVKDFETESGTSAKEKLDVLAKIMTRCDVQYSSLSQEIELACTKLSTLNVGIKLMQENLKETKRAFLMEEWNWKIEGEKHAKKTLAALGTSAVEPPQCVTVMSTRTNPIHCLSDLLIALAGRGCSIRLLLLDSFLYGVQFLNDFCRLESAITKEVGKNIKSFYGYIGLSSNWLKLDTAKLEELGLLLDSGTAVVDLNTIMAENFRNLPQGVHTTLPGQTVQLRKAALFTMRVCVPNLSEQKTLQLSFLNSERRWCTDLNAPVKYVAISRSVLPIDVSACIQIVLNTMLRLHIVELDDKEVAWFSEILKKLIPPSPQSQCQLWLHECKLSKAGMDKLVLVVKTTRAKKIHLHPQELSDAEQKQVQNIARQHGISVEYTIPNL